VLKKYEFVIASPAPASPGEAGGAERRSNLGFTIAKIEIASLPSPEEHEGRRSLAMTSFCFFSTLLKINPVNPVHSRMVIIIHNALVRITMIDYWKTVLRTTG
jgi:hypothetical protein